MKTNLKNHLVEFSQGWESYVNECMRLVDDSLRFYVTKDHRVYEVLIREVVSEIQSLLDERIYKVKGSVGQSSLTGIPWLSVMDKHVTESTQEGFYISYLFSKNAKKLHLSIALGATQFEDLYGANSKTTDKIIQAKNQFVQNFNKHAPAENFEIMDLLDEKDTNFTREFSTTMTRVADYYEGGSFFTKTYDLVNPNFEEDDIVNDLSRYVESYRKIVNDPASSVLLDVLAESVFEETDQKQQSDLNYDLPTFNPIVLESEPKDKNKKRKTTSKPSKPSMPSKKVGDAGEKYVYEFEKNKLEKLGLNDLADKIVKQYDDLSYFPGYDIQSFDEAGNEIFIEVKSTIGKYKNYFEISENEIKAAKELGDAYYIYQVTNALTDPKISTVINNLFDFEDKNKILIDPMVYRVSFKNEV
jgi:ubiquitin